MSSLAIDYRSYLRAELARRSTINPSYSLRAFARALSLAPGALSEILNGKRTLGPKKAVEITQKLALGPEERNWFLKSLERKVVVQNEENVAVDSVGKDDYEIKGFIDEDTWSITSDWLNFAVWAKLKWAPTKYDFTEMARAFKVTDEKISKTIERLGRKGFIKIHPEGEIERVDKNLKAHAPELADALRRKNKDLLIKAIDSIEDFSPKERIIGNTIFSVNSKKIKLAEEKMAQFRKEMLDFLQEGELDTVYCFSTTLFPLEKKTQGEI